MRIINITFMDGETLMIIDLDQSVVNQIVSNQNYFAYYDSDGLMNIIYKHAIQKIVVQKSGAQK